MLDVSGCWQCVANATAAFLARNPRKMRVALTIWWLVTELRGS